MPMLTCAARQALPNAPVPSCLHCLSPFMISEDCLAYHSANCPARVSGTTASQGHLPPSAGPVTVPEDCAHAFPKP